MSGDVAGPLSAMLATQKQLMESLSVVLQTYGLSLNLEKIDLDPPDCEGDCIDYVWRLRCVQKEICDMLKQRLVGGAGGGKEEE